MSLTNRERAPLHHKQRHGAAKILGGLLGCFWITCGRKPAPAPPSSQGSQPTIRTQASSTSQRGLSFDILRLYRSAEYVPNIPRVRQLASEALAMLDNDVRDDAITRVQPLSPVRAITLEQADGDGQSYSLVWLFENADGSWYCLATLPLGQQTREQPAAIRRIQADIGRELHQLALRIPPTLDFPFDEGSVPETADGSVYFLAVRDSTHARTIIVDACFLDGFKRESGVFRKGAYAEYSEAIIRIISSLQNTAAEQGHQP